MISENPSNTYYIFPQLKNYTNDNISDLDNDICGADANFIESINMDLLTRNQLAKLINIYAYNANRYSHFQKGFMTKMNIICTLIPNSISRTLEQFNESVDKYLDSLKSESIYERELDKILTNLPCICLSNISSKKILNCNNDINLLKLDNNEEFIKVD